MGWWRQRPTRDERQHDFEREVRTHLELEADERRDSGMGSEDARYPHPGLEWTLIGGRPRLVEQAVARCAGQILRYAVRRCGRRDSRDRCRILRVGHHCRNLCHLQPSFEPLQPPGRPPHELSEWIVGRAGGNALAYLDFPIWHAARSFEGIAAVD